MSYPYPGTGRDYLNDLGLTEATPPYGHAIAGNATLGNVIAGTAKGGSAVYQSADRTVAPIGPPGILVEVSPE